jgi:hypothetical protein
LLDDNGQGDLNLGFDTVQIPQLIQQQILHRLEQHVPYLRK